MNCTNGTRGVADAMPAARLGDRAYRLQVLLVDGCNCCSDKVISSAPAEILKSGRRSFRTKLLENIRYPFFLSFPSPVFWPLVCMKPFLPSCHPSVSKPYGSCNSGIFIAKLHPTARAYFKRWNTPTFPILGIRLFQTTNTTKISRFIEH